MNKKSVVIANKIQMVDFSILATSLRSVLSVNPDDVESHSLNIGYETQFNLGDKMVKSDIKVEVSAVIDGKEVGSGHFELVFIYHVENLDELALENGGKIKVNGGLSNTLASITYSTTRGILMTRFQGTVLKNFILPIINPNELVAK
jgi:hypothetical protein